MSTLASVDRTRPLFLVADPELLDELLRLAASAGVTPQVVPDITAARRWWLSASTVVVDHSTAQACQQSKLPWRAGLIIADHGKASSATKQAVHEQKPRTAIWQLASDIGADHVALLPDAQAWLVDRIRRRKTDTQTAPIICVVGGRGGAGASVLACALAVTAAHSGHRPLLVDADPLGPGLDLTLGHEEVEGTRWSELTQAPDLATATSLFDALPRIGELSVLTWDRANITELSLTAINTVLDLASQSTDVVIVDIPRYPDEATVAALVRSDLTLLIVPAEVRATFSAVRVATLLGKHCARLECVVRGPAPARLSAGNVATALQLPLAANLKAETRLAQALDQGTAPLAANPWSAWVRRTFLVT
jgi:secretion/DNA translocation related CpaE-like protein